MSFKIHPMAENAKGGTELMAARLKSAIESHDPSLLDYFDFYFSRLVDFDPDKPSIYYVHDLPEDPEVVHLRNGGWQKFDLIVFVSNWQYQQFKDKFGLDGSNCIVINNGVEEFDILSQDKIYNKWKSPETIKLIYHTTPHRGIELLYPAFVQLKSEFPNIELDVFSSFGVYGWNERDEPYKELFDNLKKTDGVTYHGAQSNETVREALVNSHIFSYPSIWKETSCLALIEAMHTGNICVHSNYGALIETGGGVTNQYMYRDNPDEHVQIFTNVLRQAIIEAKNSKQVSPQLINSLFRAKSIYSWDKIGDRWINVLSQLKTALEVE